MNKYTLRYALISPLGFLYKGKDTPLFGTIVVINLPGRQFGPRGVFSSSSSDVEQEV